METFITQVPSSFAGLFSLFCFTLAGAVWLASKIRKDHHQVRRTLAMPGCRVRFSDASSPALATASTRCALRRWGYAAPGMPLTSSRVPPDCIHLLEVAGYSLAAHLRRGDGPRQRGQPQPGAASQDGVLEPVAVLLQAIQR